MKKISNIFLVFILVISTVLCVYLYQMETSKVYDFVNTYQLNRSLHIPEGVPVDKDFLNMMKSIADKYDIIIEKSVIKVENNIVVENHYTNMTKDTLSQMFKGIKWENKESDSYKASTLQEDGYDGYIKDFFGNDYHRYFTFDALSSEDYLGGGYRIFGNNENAVVSFYKELSSLIGVDETTLYSGFQENIFPYSFVFSAYFIVIFILFFMVILFTTFDTYNKSKRFGIYKLCGYSTFDIIQVQFKKDILFYTSFLVIVSIIFFLFIPNITIPFLLLIFSMIIGIASMNILLYSIIVKVIMKKVKYNDLLKNKSLTNMMTHIAILFKSISVGILTLGFVFASVFVMLTKGQIDRLEQFSKYSNYGFFEGFSIGEDKSEMSKGPDSKLLQGGLHLYKEMYHQGVLYADFLDFSQGVSKLHNVYVANVDTNYLNEFPLYTPEGKQIYIDPNSTVFYYLIPTSKMDKIDDIRLVANGGNRGASIEYIEYTDKKLPTLNPNIAVQSDFMIDAPIVKVITLGNASVENVLAFGGYYDTPLKFQVHESKEAIFQKLWPVLDKYDLTDNLSMHNFVIYDDLFGKEIHSKKEQLSMLVTALCVVLFVIICVSFQSVLLYLKGKSKEIAVKRFLGTSKRNIFMPFFLENIVIMVLCFSVVGIIFNSQIYILPYILFAISIILLDIMIMYMTVKFKLRSFIMTILKGEQL